VSPWLHKLTFFNENEFATAATVRVRISVKEPAVIHAVACATCPVTEPRHNYREVVVTLPRINQRKHSVFIGVAYPADREAILREIGALTVLLEPERGGAPIEITDAIQSKTSCE
jgi:hypothetical protein